VIDNVVLAFQIYGLAILVSMAVAVLIKGIVSVLSRLKAREKKPEPETPEIAEAQIPVEHIVAISAAAYSMLGRHRVVHIEDAGRGLAWTVEGRAAHHASHAVSHHPKH
jgi:hypothetical protein